MRELKEYKILFCTELNSNHFVLTIKHIDNVDNKNNNIENNKIVYVHVDRSYQIGEYINQEELESGFDNSSLIDIEMVPDLLKPYGSIIPLNNSDNLASNGKKSQYKDTWDFEYFSAREVSVTFRAKSQVDAVVRYMAACCVIAFESDSIICKLSPDPDRQMYVFLLGQAVEHLFRGHEMREQVNDVGAKNNQDSHDRTTGKYIQNIHAWLVQNGHYPRKPKGDPEKLSYAELARIIRAQGIVNLEGDRLARLVSQAFKS